MNDNTIRRIIKWKFPGAKNLTYVGRCHRCQTDNLYFFTTGAKHFVVGELEGTFYCPVCHWENLSTIKKGLVEFDEGEI